MKFGRQAYALSKERDALKREVAHKAEMEAAIKERDESIADLMAEGELNSFTLFFS